MEIVPYLKLMVQKGASDLFVSVGARVHLKIEGRMIPVGDTPRNSAQATSLIYSLLNEAEIAELESEWELNKGLSISGLGRFRVNVFKQRGEVAMVVRYIKLGIPGIDELNLPPILRELVLEPRGLVLVVGATGSGKSTTLASMLDYRNQSKTGHVLTIEDPIEYLFKNNKSMINQREIGLDTKSFGNALKNAMREAPDVIMIGEIRDVETMQAAIVYAETGHLCLSTLHANNANQALDRIKNFFPDSAQKQLYMDLSLNLQAVVSQRLLKDKNGGLIPAVEVMLLSGYVAELILNGDTPGLKDAMEQSATRGMQTFDQCLYNLYKQGRITLDMALDNSDSRNDLALRVRLGQADQGENNS